MTQDYQRIVYPERAEYLADESVFRGYRIFLDHWAEITSYLQESYEVLRTRRFSKGVMILGKQGCGKSILANKITGDFEVSKSQVGTGKFAYDRDNIWHRISGGGNERTQLENVSLATKSTVILQVENKKEWITAAEKMVAGNSDRSCIVIADNCEKDYFLKGLLNVSDEVYLQTGRSDTALRAAAHRFVELCRTSLRGCLFVFFTNDEDFAHAFDTDVNSQHKGLIDIRELSMPADEQKEAIIRINVNRLNSFSYWLCIDRAGPQEKSEVWKTLKSADTFPASFNAVDNAIRSSAKNREGRPARKGVLNAFALASAASVQGHLDPDASNGEFDDLYSGTHFAVRLYRAGWDAAFGSSRDFRMLASEWHLKVIVAGDSAVAAILQGSDLAKQLVQQATVYHGTGTHNTTRDAHTQTLAQIDAALSVGFATPDNSAFWAKGSVRNHDYESKLKVLFPTYNTKTGGLMAARPDLVIDDYVPCSVLAASTSDAPAINAAIRREANIVEFTAIRDFTFPKLIAYLRELKMQNYIGATQEQ